MSKIVNQAPFFAVSLHFSLFQTAKLYWIPAHFFTLNSSLSLFLVDNKRSLLFFDYLCSERVQQLRANEQLYGTLHRIGTKIPPYDVRQRGRPASPHGYAEERYNDRPSRPRLLVLRFSRSG